MKVLKITLLVLIGLVVLGKAVSMLPPETFKDPIFAEQDSGDGGSIKEPSDFA